MIKFSSSSQTACLRPRWRQAVFASLAAHLAAGAALAFAAPRLALWVAPAASGQSSISLQLSLASDPAPSSLVRLEPTKAPTEIALEPTPLVSDSPPLSADTPVEAAAPASTAVDRSTEPLSSPPLLVRAPEAPLTFEPSDSPSNERQTVEVAAPLPQAMRDNTKTSPRLSPLAPRPSPLSPPVQTASLPSVASAPSPASKASTGTTNAPRVVSNPAPAYPADALAAGRTGRVVVRVSIDTNGAVLEAQLHRSSGHVSLDQAALAAVRRWRFSKAEEAQTVRRVDVPIDFVLGKRSP